MYDHVCIAIHPCSCKDEYRKQHSICTAFNLHFLVEGSINGGFSKVNFTLESRRSAVTIALKKLRWQTSEHFIFPRNKTCKKTFMFFFQVDYPAYIHAKPLLMMFIVHPLNMFFLMVVVWYFSAKPRPENSRSWLSTLVSYRLAASLPSASHFYFNYVILGWLVLPMAPWHRKFPRSFYPAADLKSSSGLWRDVTFHVLPDRVEID